MTELTFFCLAAKVRKAQQKYYAFKQKGEEKQKLLKNSIQLEKLLDDEIRNRINNATDEEKKDMAIEWANYVLCRQIDDINL